MNRWGITLPLTGVPLAAHRDLVRELPDLGYTDVWSAETAGTDAFTPLALTAEWAPELRLGTAIAPIYTRGPGLLAMQAATIAELAPGRFVLGVGTSTPTIVTGWNGFAFDEPYARARDTLRFLRSPTPPPPIVLAALRPGMLRLAAREADGAITNWLAPADVPTVRSALGDDPELVARIFVCPTEDADAARGLGRMLISSYLTVPVYAAFHEWLGRGDVLAPMHEAWQAGDRAAANAAIPDEVVDDLIVWGPAAKCRERVAAYVESGLDTPVISVLPTGADPASLVRSLAPA
jgi:probable F420-dependent oxidoreductase